MWQLDPNPTWSVLDGRALSEKRRQHAALDAAWQAEQARLARPFSFTLRNENDARLAGSERDWIRETWSHEQIMDLIVGGGKYVHPDLVEVRRGRHRPGHASACMAVQCMPCACVRACVDDGVPHCWCCVAWRLLQAGARRSGARWAHAPSTLRHTHPRNPALAPSHLHTHTPPLLAAGDCDEPAAAGRPAARRQPRHP